MKNKLSYYLDQALEFANKNLKKVVSLGILIFILYTFVFSDYGLIVYFKNKMIAKDLREEIQKEIQMRDSLNYRINQLKYDTLEIEKIARELYGMSKPNEKLYIYKNQSGEKNEK